MACCDRGGARWDELKSSPRASLDCVSHKLIRCAETFGCRVPSSTVPVFETEITPNCIFCLTFFSSNSMSITLRFFLDRKIRLGESTMKNATKKKAAPKKKAAAKKKK